MKNITTAVLVLTLLSTPAYARLGEDVNTASHRYGEPVKEEQMENYDRKLFYNDPPYNLAITYKDGRVVIIEYRLAGEAQRMSLWRIEHILHNNAKKEGGWKSIWYFSNRIEPQGRIHFINEQQNAVAVYDLTDDTLTVRFVNR